MSFIALVVLGSFARPMTASEDLASLLQQPQLPLHGASSQAVKEESSSSPFVIGLRRESVPVYRRGKVASFKTSYSGILNVGSPAQEFRVVFDTGSGNIVLPAVECLSEACLMPDRRRFNMSASSSALAVNEDGSAVPEGGVSDSVTIGFGTGEITGEFLHDRVCFGSPAPPSPVSPSSAAVVEAAALASLDAVSLVETQEAVTGSPATAAAEKSELCVEMSVILAVEMSSQPFKTFRFDGILGLGLNGLAMNKKFSAFETIMGTGLPSSHFGVFLTEGEEGEESEIAMGGIDHRRLLEPLSWAPVAMPELGYWQVPIKEVRIGGQVLDICRDGTCRGVVDTGTSHLGVPAPHDATFAELLTREAKDLLDCRLVDAPVVEIDLPDYTLTLHPFNYMRRLPLREGVSVSSPQGVHVPTNETNATLGKPSSADPVGANATNNHSNATGTAAPAVVVIEEDVRRFCRPRLMPVRLPEPLGPKLFILGEPVLHRYYTVYDWADHRVGFSLANNRRNTMDPSEFADIRGALPEGVDKLLMQQSVSLTKAGGSRRSDPREDVVALVQVTLKLSVRTRRL